MPKKPKHTGKEDDLPERKHSEPKMREKPNENQKSKQPQTTIEDPWRFTGGVDKKHIEALAAIMGVDVIVLMWSGLLALRIPSAFLSVTLNLSDIGPLWLWGAGLSVVALLSDRFLETQSPGWSVLGELATRDYLVTFSLFVAITAFSWNQAVYWAPYSSAMVALCVFAPPLILTLSGFMITFLGVFLSSISVWNEWKQKDKDPMDLWLANLKATDWWE